MNIAKIIKLKRQSYGLTQTELANKSGLSLPTIQNIEAGIANPSLQTIESLFAVLNIKLLLTKEAELERDWLIAFGVPLSRKEQHVVGRDALIKNAPRLIKSFLLEKEDSEIFKATAAFLYALRDHYSDTYKIMVSEDFEKVEAKIIRVDPQTLVILKTRALANLAKYMSQTQASVLL